MQHRLEVALIIVLSIGFVLFLGHEAKMWGKNERYVASVQTQRAVHLEKVSEEYIHLLHRIWIDNPAYVEDVLFESIEFIKLDSLMGEWGDTFEYWSEEDSIAYCNNIERQAIETDLYLKHYRKPDNMPQQAN